MTGTDARRPVGPEITGIVAGQGGCGQTTVSLDWAQALGRRGRRCLILEIAGGDMAARAGVGPTRYTEDVAQGMIPAEKACVRVCEGVDLLATGNDWAVFGPPGDALQHRLVQSLLEGPWTDWIVDLGRTRPHRHHPIWSRCGTLAVVLQDELACLTQTYAVVRRLTACAWNDRLGLVLNRMTGGEQAARLRRQFDRITRAFLHTSVPVIGVIPNGDSQRRAMAVTRWVLPTTDTKKTCEQQVSRVVKPAFVADTTI
jgi:MinD-like ATPase involved in chromosome partitioning or flagellar assembly